MGAITRETADRWSPACDEYFDKFAQGIYDRDSQLQFILPEKDVQTDVDRGDLIVGHAGVDGIYFCFREGRTGIFAYYGIENVHVLVAPDLTTLVRGWNDGSITV